MRTTAFAPAKVNLYLRVGPPGPDGYHPISTLAVFADVGDRVTIEEATTSSFRITGPFAPALNELDDNLVLRAIREFEAATAMSLPPLAVTLDKELPVAAGLGGGSSDGAAALRLLRDRYRPDMSDAELASIALELGADGPMCLAARPVIAEGRGERLKPVHLASLWAVLVNPGVESPTPTVFRRFDELGRFSPLSDAHGASGPGELSSDFRSAINDLEVAAVSLDSRVGEVLDWLRRQPEAELTRLSGSGATSFALCQNETSARSLVRRLQDEQPQWWSCVCRLGGPWDW